MMEETRYKFPGNVNLICFGLRLFMQSENKQWQFQKCLQFADSVTEEIWSFALLCARKIRRALQQCTIILSLCP